MTYNNYSLPMNTAGGTVATVVSLIVNTDVRDELGIPEEYPEENMPFAHDICAGGESIDLDFSGEDGYPVPLAVGDGDGVVIEAVMAEDGSVLVEIRTDGETLPDAVVLVDGDETGVPPEVG